MYVLKVNNPVYLPNAKSTIRYFAGVISVAWGMTSASLLIQTVEMFILMPSTPDINSQINKLAGSFTLYLILCAGLFLLSVFSDEYVKFQIDKIYYLLPAFFAFFCGCVALVFGATAASSYPIYLPVLAALAGFSLIERGAEKFRLARQILAKSADEIIGQSQQRSITLYLRSFRIDEENAPEYYSLSARENRILTWRVLNPMFWIERRELSFEEIICKGIGVKGPIVAVGQPGETLPLLGAARKYLPNNCWQTEVSRLMDISDVVCIIPGFTESVSWELQHLFSLKNHRKILLVLEQNISWTKNWYKLREVLEKIIFIKFPETLPPNPLAIAFTSKWEPIIFVGIPKVSNYREIIKCVKKL